MNTTTFGTYTVSTGGLTLPLETTGKPADTPKGLIVTRGVETKAGWVGQVVVDKEIIFETSPYEESADAMEEVNGYVVGRIKRLFAPKTA